MYYIRVTETDGDTRTMASAVASSSAYDLLMRFSKIQHTVKIYDAITGGKDVTSDVISSQSGGSKDITEADVLDFLAKSENIATLDQVLVDNQTEALALYGFSTNQEEEF